MLRTRVGEDGFFRDMLGVEGFFRAFMLRAEGLFMAARDGDEGFLNTGQEPARCLRASPGPPSKRIATTGSTRVQTAVLEIILYLEKVRLPSLASYQLKMTLSLSPV